MLECLRNYWEHTGSPTLQLRNEMSESIRVGSVSQQAQHRNLRSQAKTNITNQLAQLVVLTFSAERAETTLLEFNPCQQRIETVACVANGAALFVKETPHGR